MFNYRQSDIIERDTYVDEFELSKDVSVNNGLENLDARTFNSKIADNFDRIMNYDVYNKQAEAEHVNSVYNKYTNYVNPDINPSSTTMQFRGLNKAEIYRDVKADEIDEPKVYLRTRGKVMLAVLSIVLVFLAALIVLNTALLNSMNALIAQKNTQIETLIEEKAAKQEILEDVSSKEAIEQKAEDLGYSY